jgi:putative salt-induced outer membrane protein YdiY
VKRLEGGKLVIETSYAGEIPIDWDMVKSFTSETGTELELSLGSGEAVVGQISMPGPDQLEVKTQQETLSYSRSEIADFGPVVVPRDYGFFDLWTGGINFGFNLSKGNTDLTNFSLTADPTRKTEKDRIAVNYASLLTEQDGESTANAHMAGVRYDRYIAQNLFVYGAFGWQKDGKASLDYRYRSGGGLGYDYQPAEHTIFTFMGGVSGFREKYEGLENNSEAEGDFGVEMTSKVLDPFELKARTRFAPVFSGGRYFSTVGAGIGAPLFGRLNWGFEVLNLYDSKPPEGIEKNDFRLLTTLGWTF